MRAAFHPWSVVGVGLMCGLLTACGGTAGPSSGAPAASSPASASVAASKPAPAPASAASAAAPAKPAASSPSAASAKPAGSTAAKPAAASAAPSGAPAKPAASAGAVTLPALPAPVAVSLDPKTTNFLVLDINSAVCPPRPACMASVPVISGFLKKVREAKVPVIYSSTANATTLPDVAPQGNEPTVVGRADKFIGTDLENMLKKNNPTTLLVVGSAANGAVLYTSFHANVLGYTVVVAEDGISTGPAFDTFLAEYQLLNQPGLSNPTNKPLAEKAVTLSRTNLISFM